MVIRSAGSTVSCGKADASAHAAGARRSIQSGGRAWNAWVLSVSRHQTTDCAGPFNGDIA
ncbi:hypothetical protein Sa4125_13500 [Aureimonas sp. SA4125]|nr:hypothetical protein Sa4125_13500 [Aureimonas sp. SA4125]